MIIPELCSGCPQCVKACPMDCIYEDLEGQRNGTPEELWKKVEQRENEF
ncbi:TPA: 4Fe-4S binding protein [Corynebacterium striatum]|uniref:4Fe-4S binding protein n=1 Tax=Corynebacterium striatum TaxID=43770 RepID=A0ABX7DEV9_CORST|nr:4Fe-4S binding protein [Corynebacterium striatum]HBC4101505.1 4Fe-4S binding protein [Corynebacterium striatum]HCD1552115.1 4Fe-4S binding protein [Corynebacterium striatum]HCD1825174.1 4Fe-4S binding protein [Corynebacterium striatum]HCD2181950.1 4Fe-4S binding protein [Corynebacterium striatum]